MKIEDAIQHLYQTFSSIERPQKIILFECVTCLSIDTQERLLNYELNQLGSYDFGEIIESCNVRKMGDICYKYYIPRILELLVIWRFKLSYIEKLDFSMIFIDNIYEVFGKFDYQNTFNNNEKRSIDIFFSSFLEEVKNIEGKQDHQTISDIAKTGFDVKPYM